MKPRMESQRKRPRDQTQCRSYQLGKTDWPACPDVLLALPSQQWGRNACHHAWLLKMDSGNQTQVLVHDKQVLNA